MAKMPDYDKMNETQLIDTYIKRCRQQGISARSSVPKTKSRLIEVIMRKDILLALRTVADAAGIDKRDGPMLVGFGGGGGK